MTRLVDQLRTLPRADLFDLLSILVEGETLVTEDEPTTNVAGWVVDELCRLLGLAQCDPDLVERHLVSRLSNALGLNYPPGATPEEMVHALETAIGDALVAEMRPFIQVAVCVGWADGRLSPEEIALVDAATTRLRLLKRRRSELLALCNTRISSSALAALLAPVASDEQKAWSLLAFGWAVALADLRTDPQELAAFNDLAAALTIAPEKAEPIRQLVSRRFRDSLVFSGIEPDGKAPMSSRSQAKATLAAIQAAELDQYLQAKTGLKTLSVLLAAPGGLRSDREPAAQLASMIGPWGWLGANTLLAGTLFLRRLEGRPDDQKLLVILLTCLERGR